MKVDLSDGLSNNSDFSSDSQNSTDFLTSVSNSTSVITPTTVSIFAKYLRSSKHKTLDKLCLHYQSVISTLLKLARLPYIEINFQSRFFVT